MTSPRYSQAAQSPFYSMTNRNEDKNPSAESLQGSIPRNSESGKQNEDNQQQQQQRSSSLPGGKPGQNQHGEEVPYIYGPDDPAVQFKRKPKRKVTFIENIFATRQLAAKGDRQTYIRYTVRELFVYLVYLAVLVILAFCITPTRTSYDYTKVVVDLFLEEPIAKGEERVLNSVRTFRSSIHVLDFWLFVTNVLPHYLYWESWYSSSLKTSTLKTSAERNKHFVRKRFANESTGILYQNELLGVPRLRQLRVKKFDCPGRNYRHLRRDECFPPYKVEYEEDGDNGQWPPEPGAKSPNLSLTESAWKYKSEKELDGSRHWGKLATYSGAGAVCNLGKNSNRTADIISQLKNGLWINRATRVVFLDFTVYNSNLNLFCIVRLTWEFAPTGGMTTSWSLKTVRLLRYIDSVDFYVVLPCEIIFCIFTLYYLIQECIEISRLGIKKYLSDVWSWVDFGIIIISSLCIGFSIYRYFLVDEKLIKITKDKNSFADFEFLGFWQILVNQAISLCLFFSWVKLFKYISFNKTMTQLSRTLSRCAKDIGGFAVMFFLCFFAFAQLGYLLFGSQLEDFSTFSDSILSLLRLILGDFNFRQLETANRVLGPIYFLAYVFFVFFVLLNMFLAIINDTYSEVKAEIQASQNEFEISDYFWGIWNNCRGMFGHRSTKRDAANTVKIAAADGQITYEELRQHLRDAHFSELEVEMFLARYELDPKQIMEEKDMYNFINRLEDNDGQEDEFDVIGDETGQKKSVPDYLKGFPALHDRIVTLETSLTNFIEKAKMLKSRIEAKKEYERKQQVPTN